MPGPGPARLRVAEPPISSILLMSRGRGQNLTSAPEGLAQKSPAAAEGRKWLHRRLLMPQSQSKDRKFYSRRRGQARVETASNPCGDTGRRGMGLCVIRKRSGLRSLAVYPLTKPRHCAGFSLLGECLLLAESRHSDPVVLRQWLGYMNQLFSIFECGKCGLRKIPTIPPQIGPTKRQWPTWGCCKELI